MEMRVERLRDTLDLLKPVIPRKPTLAVLCNVLLKKGRAEATDLETAVSLELPEANGQCLIPYHTVIDLLKRIPGNDTLTIQQKGKSLSFAWSDGKASYETADPQDYPSFPKFEVKAQQSVDGGTLVPALSSVVDYCATDEKRTVLLGVTLFLGENLEVAAGDGFRMAYKSLPIAFPVPDMGTAIIPAHAVRVFEHLWDKTSPEPPTGDTIVQRVTAKRKVEVAMGDEWFGAKFGRVKLAAKLIKGNSPLSRNLLPQETKIEVRVIAREFLRAARSVSDAAKDGSGAIRLSWTETVMAVSAKGTDKGEVETTIPVQADSAGRIAISADYLLDYLKGREGLVTMAITGEQSPALFRHGTGPAIVLMPMKVQW